MTEFILVGASLDEKPDVAAWLLATADAKGVDRKLIQTRNGGFLVPAELLDEVAPMVTEPVAVTPESYDPGPDNVSATPPEPDRETVRAWAKAQGIEVAEKGQLRKAVWDAYEAAHS